MAKIEYVKEIDDLIKIQTVFATATDKSGLFGNRRKDESIIAGLPENGLIGVLFNVNPDALVISTGGTAAQLQEAGYKVQEIGDFTGWPEMITGLVKSMHPKLYVGMLAHPYTASDAEYMAFHKVPSVDMVLANFYPFKSAVANNPLGTMIDIKGEEEPVAAFEVIRQNMDVGGPTGIHTSRKGLLTTAATTEPEDYVRFAEELKKYNGCISKGARLQGAKSCARALRAYHTAIDDFMQGITEEHLDKAYPIIHNRVGGD